MIYTPYNDATRRVVRHALARAEAAAARRQPGLVQRNWDLESDAVTIDHEAAATDLVEGLPDECKEHVSMSDAKAAIAYALEGNTDAVLI